VLIVKINQNSSEVEFIGRNIGGAKKIVFGNGLMGNIVQSNKMIFNVNYVELMHQLNNIGHTPLPPYIVPGKGMSEPNIRRIYQTIYANNVGSAAAPTAGFHFTQELMNKLKTKGVILETVTLHVGLGTFAPVKVETIEDHIMHNEYFSIDEDVQKRLVEFKERGKRVIAVGTTSVRVLESDWSKQETNIFIYPGYKFKFIDAMITNFHLPKSTLLMLVSAFAGRELILKAYLEAVKRKYRFFSFGDAMFIK
jgi:S-adenosylmethionine:tRNA ribosyltransferase-isomerase